MSPYLLREEIQVLRDKWQGRPLPELYRELSDLLFNAGKIPAAMNLMEHSLSLEAYALDFFPFSTGTPASISEDGESWFHRGLEYADACLYEEACACMNLALMAGCDTFETHYCLAGLHKSLGRLNEAETHCKKSLEDNPGFSPAFILLGSILRLNGCLSESAAAVEKALLLNPDCAPAYYDLACYRALAGAIGEAMAALEMALIKGFCDFEWIRRDPDLDILRLLPEFGLLLQTRAAEKS